MRQVVALGSLKGAPGVSTLALALAAAWPQGGAERPVVVEADAAGGDLAVRFGLSDLAGLLALAAGAGQDGPRREAGTCVQEAAGGLRLVVAPTGAEQAGPSVAQVAACPSVLRGGADDGGVALLDVGRLGTEASRDLARTADRLLLVARGRADALAHIAARPPWLQELDPQLAVVGPCRYDSSDMARALAMEREQIHLVPWDAAAGAALAGGRCVSERRWRRSPLARAAFALARRLAGAEGESESSGSGLCGELAQLASRTVPRQLLGRTTQPRPLEKGGAP